MAPSRLLFFPETLALFHAPVARAGRANITIDDTDTRYFTFDRVPIDNPPSWAAISPMEPCVYCSAQPPTADIYNQTWHDGEAGSTGSFTFQGSAVYIYGIDLSHPANISFALGGTTAYHYYNGTAQFVFNALFFSAHGLDENSNHTVSWVFEKSDANGTTGLIDYAVFMTTSIVGSSVGSSRASTKSHIRAIVGAVVGGVLGLLLIGVIFFLFVRRRRRRMASDDSGCDRDAGPRVRRLRENRAEQFPLPVGSPTEPLPPGGAMSVISEPQTIVGYIGKPLGVDTSPPGSLKTQCGFPTSDTMVQPVWTVISDPSTTSAMASSPSAVTGSMGFLRRDAETVSLAPTTSTEPREALDSRMEFLEAQMELHISSPQRVSHPPPYQLAHADESMSGEVGSLWQGA